MGTEDEPYFSGAIADAIVGVKFTTASMMRGAAELLAYGAAVKIAKRN